MKFTISSLTWKEEWIRYHTCYAAHLERVRLNIPEPIDSPWAQK